MSPNALRQTLTTTLAAAVMAGVALVTAAPSHAQADTSAQQIRAYYTAMNGLTAAIDDWNADVTTALSAAATKPEFICSAEFAEIVRRGHGMTNDFEGTGLGAPQALGANHDGAAQGLRLQTEGLSALTQRCQPGGQTGAGAMADVEAGKAAYAKAVRLIRYYAAQGR